MKTNTMKAKIWMTGVSMASVLSLSTLGATAQAFQTFSKPHTFLPPTSFSINTSVLWNAQIDVPYSEQLQAGTVVMIISAPNTNRVHRAMAAPSVTTSDKWVITQGNLPTGLTLSDSGLVSGTPTGPVGTNSVTVQVTDANGQTATRTFTITVFGVHTLQVTTLSLPTGIAGKPYQSKLSATGGQGTYMWKVAQGTLPVGVTLSADGTLAGTPQKAGTYAITVQAFDALGDSAAQYYQWTVSKSKN